MIHVAPCFCELHVRIRELEAELASLRFRHAEQFKTDVETFNAMTARAEKAEARVEKVIAALDVEHQEVIEQKARVAELADALDWHHRWYDDKDECKVAKSLRLREREAD